MEWTRPYHGVTHLVTPRICRVQFTAEDHGGCATGSVIHYVRGWRGPTEWFPNVAEAKAWLEARALEMFPSLKRAA